MYEGGSERGRKWEGKREGALAAREGEGRLDESKAKGDASRAPFNTNTDASVT